MRDRIARARARGDEGAALVLALIVITVIALSLSALLTLSDTSVRTTVGLRDQVADTYNADGAMQAAINNLRNSSYNHNAGQYCFGSSDTLQLPNFHGTDSAAVTCEADPKKVLIHCPSLSDCNRPGNAILTLGKIAGEDGLNIQQPTGSTFRVHGNVFSNSNINVVNGALNTNANAFARGSCSGTIQANPVSCNIGSAANPLGDDPGYAPAATIAALPHRKLPSCTTPNSVIRFEPGYYDDAYGLSDMMSSSSKCKGSTFWFPPVYDGSGRPAATGVYYFDFHNTGANANPLLNTSGETLWTVDNGYLVAGTPVNSAGTIISAPPLRPTIPGSCDNPINNPNAIGVQFIFGGESRLAVKAAQAELCGTYDSNKAPVALYGLSSGSETTTAWDGTNALKLTSVARGGGFGASVPPASIAAVDGTFASWTSKSKNDSTVLTVGDYVPPTTIPEGSILQSAAVKIVHRHSDPTSTEKFDVTVKVKPSDLTVSGSLSVPSNSGAFRTDVIPVDAARTGAIADAVYKGTFSGATIDFAPTLVNPNKNDALDIDAIQLELKFTPPAFRGGSGCVTSGPYTGNGSTGANCALVVTPNNAGNQLYVQGTTYTPKAALDITLNNAAEQIFRFGVVARSLWIKETGSFSYGGVVIEVPDDSPGFVFSLYLSAYICSGSGPCSTGGAPVLRSKVALVDANPMTPSPGHRQVTVLSWSRPG